MPVEPVDPWTAFLQWLQTILVPDWNGLIQLMPILLICRRVGPALSLWRLYWLYVIFTNAARQGSVRRANSPARRARPRTAPRSSRPTCPTAEPTSSIYPATSRVCEVDGEELSVRCPVDETVRVAGQELCRTCGTRYQLGASLAPVRRRSRGQPPAGGAAVA